VAYPDDIAGDYAPPPLYTGEWPPPEWATEPGPQLQPGLGGIPASVVDNALAAPADPNYVDPASIQMEDPSYVDPASIEMEPPPALVPDAITGAGAPMPPQLNVADVTGAPQFDPIPYTPVGDAPASPLPSEAEAQSWQDKAAALRRQIEENRQALHGMTDEQFAGAVVQEEDANRSAANAEQIKALYENERREQDNLAVFRTSVVKARATSDQITADANKLAERRIDPDRRGVGQRILGALAAIIGGIAAPSNGGRNVALEMISKSIEQDIDAQKADIANAWRGVDTRKAGLSTQRELDHEDFVATEATRLAWWKRIDKELEIKRQSFAKGGSTDMRMEAAQREIRAKHAAAEAAMMSEAEKRALENEKRALEIRKQAEVERAHREDEKVAKQNAATSAWNAAISNKKTNSDIAIANAKLGPDLAKTQAEIDKLKGEGKLKEAEQLQKFGVPGIEEPVLAADGKPVMGADGRPVTKTFTATSGSEVSIDAMNDKLAKSRELISLIDEVRRKRTGWTTDVGNTAEHQELETLTQQINVTYKDALKLGAITKSDEELINGVRGFADATGRKSIEAGLVQARKNIIRSRNEELKSHGYKGKWDIEDIQANKNIEQPGDAEAKAVMRDPAHVDNAYAELWPDGLINGEARGPKGAEVVAELAKHGGMLPSQRATIDGWAAAATGADDAARRAAIEKLDVTSKTAESENVRNYALRVLAASAQSAFPAPSPEAVQ
jgi:hypothetical protein